MLADTLANESCLVTGAAGFIGSHLVERLLALGARVIGIDNLVLGQKAHLTKAFANSNFRFGQIDLNDRPTCLDFIGTEHARKPIHTVWHLAANSDIQAGTRDPEVDLRLTFLTTYNLLPMMQTLGIPRI